MRRVPIAAWAILVVALVLRLRATALLTDRLEPGADELAYRTIAASVAAGDGFPDRPQVAGGGPSASNPPGYPYALGAVSRSPATASTPPVRPAPSWAR